MTTTKTLRLLLTFRLSFSEQIILTYAVSIHKQVPEIPRNFVNLLQGSLVALKTNVITDYRQLDRTEICN